MVFSRHRFSRYFLIARSFYLRLYARTPLFLLPRPYPSQDGFSKFYVCTFAFRKPLNPLTRI
jgi:hypothetical protein